MRKSRSQSPSATRRDEKSKVRSQNIEKFITLNSKLLTERGIALVTAIIISLASLLLVTSVLYFIIQSTNISGAGKRYASASEAADGSVEVMKEAINLVMYGESVTALPLSDTANLSNAILNVGEPATVTLTLPSATWFQSYAATITVERLYSSYIPGGRIEFARGGGSAPSTAVYYRISTVVTGPNNTRAETTALYMYAQ